MRNLSRINQAYYMGIGEYLGVGYNYEPDYMQKIRSLTVEDVQAAAAKYLDTENYVIATVGKI